MEREPMSGRAGKGLTRAELIKRGGVAAAGLSLGGLLAACGSGGGGGGASTAVAAAKTPRNALVAAIEGDVDTFDPAFGGSKPAQEQFVNTLDTLTRYPAAEREIDGMRFAGVNTDEIVGMLAEEVDNQGDRVIMTLREDAAYADGTPLTGPGVARSFERIFESTPSVGLLQLSGMPDPSYIRALDDRRIEFKLDRPNDFMLRQITEINFSPLDPAQIAEHATRRDPWASEWFRENLASATGPYQLETYRPGDQIVLRARPDYWGEKPALDTVIQKIVPDSNQRVLLLKRGEVDVIRHAAVKELDGIAEDPNLKVLSFPVPRAWMWVLSMDRPPFDNKQVRQAMNYAAPYEAVVRDIFHGYATRGRGFVDMGEDTSWFPYETTDLRRAAELLAAAGFPNGEGLPPIKITVESGQEEFERAAVLIQANLRQINVPVEIEKLPTAAFNEQVWGRKLQSFLFSAHFRVADPYHPLWNMAQTRSPANWPGFSDPRVDAIIDRWTLSADKEPRLEAAREAQRIITEEAPYIHLASPNYNIAMRKAVEGYRYYNDELTRYAEMSKAA